MVEVSIDIVLLLEDMICVCGRGLCCGSSWCCAREYIMTSVSAGWVSGAFVWLVVCRKNARALSEGCDFCPRMDTV